MQSKRKTLIIVLLVFSAIIFLKGENVYASGEPVIYFSDLTDGSVSGWEQSQAKGAAVSIWGNNLGSSRGSSYVTVGGVDLTNDSDYAEWGVIDSTENYYNGYNSARELQRITFWLNSNMTLGNTTITVTTTDGTSESIPFYTRNTGSIYFLATNGNDSNNGLTVATAWENPSKAREALQTGDTIYFRAGNYINEDNWDSVIDFWSNNHNNGAENNSISMVSYPGEFAQIGDGSIGSSIRHHGSAGDELLYWTFSKFILRAAGGVTHWVGGAVEPGRDEYIRFIANDMSSTEGHKTIFPMGGRSGGQQHLKVYGNYIHDAGVDNRGDISGQKAYGIYFNGYGWHNYIDLGWNEVAHNTQGRGIQLYGHKSVDYMDNVIIHDNYIHDNDMTGVVLGGGDGAEDYRFLRNVNFYNNLVVNNGAGINSEYYRYNGLHVGGGIYSSGRYGGNFKIYNNVFYQGQSDGNHIAINGNNEDHEIDSVELFNNIIYHNNSFIEISGDSCSDYCSGSNNVYFGGASDIPSWDISPITSNPLFTSPSTSDFSLQSTSPAIDAGTSNVSSVVTTDFLGITRPQGSAYDIGAYEYNNTTTTIIIIRSDTNQDQTINSTDALLILRNSLGLDMTSTSWQDSVTTGDANCDNISNSTDAMLILRYSLGLSMSGTDWCK